MEVSKSKSKSDDDDGPSDDLSSSSCSEEDKIPALKILSNEQFLVAKKKLDEQAVNK